MDFKEILDNKEKNTEVTLGYNEDGLVKSDLKDNPSIIITGETGSGKSILLDQILLQLINRYTSIDMSLMVVDTSGVELNYYCETNYVTFSAINDLDKSIVALSRLIKEIEKRKQLLKDSACLTIDEYNEKNVEKIPLLLLAIDDDKFLLREPDTEKMLSGIMSQLVGLNIFVILSTSDVHNKFFETDANILASTLISFDYTNPIESKKNNIEGSDNLGIGEFLLRHGSTITKYHNFEFDDALIKEVLRID